MKTLSFGVEGMACGHCKASVENALKAVSGVAGAVADLDAKTATVTCEDAVLPDALYDAVEAVGFDPIRA